MRLEPMPNIHLHTLGGNFSVFKWLCGSREKGESVQERNAQIWSMCGPVCESMGKMKRDSRSLERRVLTG